MINALRWNGGKDIVTQKTKKHRMKHRMNIQGKGEIKYVEKILTILN